MTLEYAAERVRRIKSSRLFGRGLEKSSRTEGQDRSLIVSLELLREEYLEKLRKLA